MHLNERAESVLVEHIHFIAFQYILATMFWPLFCRHDCLQVFIGYGCKLTALLGVELAGNPCHQLFVRALDLRLLALARGLLLHLITWMGPGAIYFTY